VYALAVIGAGNLIGLFVVAVAVPLVGPAPGAALAGLNAQSDGQRLSIFKPTPSALYRVDNLPTSLG
jgi:hypothetical protein